MTTLECGERRLAAMLLAAGTAAFMWGTGSVQAGPRSAGATPRSGARAAAAPAAAPGAPATAAPAPAAAGKAESAPRMAADIPASEESEDEDSALEDSEDEARPPLIRALLINGGSSAVKNYLSHFHHLQDMVGALRARGIPPERIDIFSSDGEDPGKDLAVRDTEPAGFAIVEGTPAGRALRPPELTSSVWEGVTLHPARLRELRKWFRGTGRTLRPGDTLFLFVTDHGSRNAEDPGNGLISLWGETLSVLEYRALLGYLRPGVKVVNVMSQCFSGAFADAMAPLSSGTPGGDVCGFYSTTGDREAYGCYPEGRDKDRTGHAFRFIDLMGRHASLEDVHGAVLVTDTTPDVPVRTSDLYLERLVSREASRRKTSLEETADDLLRIAWKDRARWEPEIRLLDKIGEVYGTFSPRTLAELQARIDNLGSLSKELDTYEDRWKVTLDDLRKENLDRFQASHPEWKERLDEKKLPLLDAAGRRKTLSELIPAMTEYTAGKPDVQARYQDLLTTDEDARSARYRTDTRLAALLRMRTILLRVAGEQLLDVPPGEDPAHAPARLVAARAAFASLRQCEGLAIGDVVSAKDEIPPLRETIAPLPPFEEDQAAVRRALPSWLGIRFQPAPEKQLDTLKVARGAAIVEQVYPDGPALAAGIAPGDILLGPPGSHFSEPTQIREWTMTSERGKPIALDIQRDGRIVQTTVTLVPYPTKIPDLPAPPKEGDEAPRLDTLKLVREEAKPRGDFRSRRHMVFFWATWCGPCKSSVPELLAWSRASGIPVVAISDEDEDTVKKFLVTWSAPFPEIVASDELRRSHVTYGVSGTPTFVLVDEKGKIEWRHVGYSPKEHLGIPGWKWADGQ
jgi:thiol-disulfide isomerase/thioredoxin